MDDDRDLLDYDDPELLAALRHFLEMKGWRQSELARRAQINSSTISDWFKGRYGPGSEALRALCRVFGVSRSQFFATGEEMVAQHRRAEQARRLAEEVDRKRGAQKIAEVLMRLEPKLRQEVMRILRSKTRKKGNKT